jgi:hypothetical protein
MSLSSAFGFAGIALVAAAAFGLWGWPAACFVLGAPFATFYLWGEAKRMRGGE